MSWGWLRAVVLRIAEIVPCRLDRRVRFVRAGSLWKPADVLGNVVDRPVTKRAFGRIGIFHDQGKALCTLRCTLPFDRWRDIAAIAAVALRDGLILREGRAVEYQCHCNLREHGTPPPVSLQPLRVFGISATEIPTTTLAEAERAMEPEPKFHS